MNPMEPQEPRPPEDAAPEPSSHTPPPGAHAMNLIRWVLFVAVLLIAVGSVTGYVAHKRAVSRPVAAKQALYHCPMHPTYTSDRPGKCPICGMDLEKIETSGAKPASAGSRHILFYRNPMNPSVTSPVPMKDEMGMDYVPVYSDEVGSKGAQQSDVAGLATVRINPERVQLIGVRTYVVSRRRLGAGLELVGFVTPDEARIKRVQLQVAGWVRRLMVDRTGETVAAGEPLLTLYSPELYQSEREFLIELEAIGNPAGRHDPNATEAARERLRLMGVPADEIARLERERSASTQLTLHAPSGGTVLDKGVVEGQYVGPDTPLLTLADLSRVWLMADVYEMDVQRVRAGDRVRFTAEALPGRTFEGRVDFVYPTVSPETRTVKARIVVENRDGTLKPGMFGTVHLSSSGRPAVAVPAEAIVFTGESPYVFLSHRDGRFVPRRVTLGRQDPDWFEVTRGLAVGDTVVSSASFLIDSESRLQAAIAGAGGSETSGSQE